MFGNRWQPQTTCAGCAYVQAIFRRRRHQARRPPLAKIRPGSPAPTMGPGTLTERTAVPENAEFGGGIPVLPFTEPLKVPGNVM